MSIKILPTVDEIVNDRTARKVTREAIRMAISIVVECTGVTHNEARAAVTRLIANHLEETN